jgi:hypothetical protein
MTKSSNDTFLITYPHCEATHDGTRENRHCLLAFYVHSNEMIQERHKFVYVRRKQKAWLCPSMLWRHIGGVQIYNKTLLKHGTGQCGVVISNIWLLYPQGWSHSNHWEGGLGGPKTSLDVLGREKSLASAKNQTLCYPTHSPVIVLTGIFVEFQNTNPNKKYRRFIMKNAVFEV